MKEKLLKEQRELTLKDHYSLSVTLSAIHKAFIVLHAKTEQDKKTFLNKFIKLHNEDLERNTEKSWQYVADYVKGFQDSSHDVLSPITLFQEYNIPAYIGEIDHGVLFCKGMVIGLKFSLTATANISYRLDFGSDQKLHINFEVYDGKEKYPICAPLNFSTGRYGFSQKDKQAALNNEDKMLALLECTKMKFWLKMTIGKTLTDLNLRQDAPQHHDDTVPREQLLAFIQGNVAYDFGTLKEYIRDLLPNDIGKTRIMNCKTEKDLMKCMIEKPVIRSKTRHDIFMHLSEQDPTHRLFSGAHHMYEVDSVDSEQRIDSETESVGMER